MSFSQYEVVPLLVRNAQKCLTKAKYYPIEDVWREDAASLTTEKTPAKALQPHRKTNTKEDIVYMSNENRVFKAYTLSYILSLRTH